MAKYKELTNDERGAMIDFYNRGLYSQRELADIFEVSRATVRRVVRESPPTLSEEAHPEQWSDQSGWPAGPDVGLSGEVGQPTNPNVGLCEFDWDDGEPQGAPTWLAVLIAVGVALWVVGIIYFAIY